MSTTKEAWGSRLGLILAMAGNSVGLGNFLRFPVQAVQNGGGAFLIPYLVCFLLMGIPLLWVEWSMGRLGGRHGHHSSPFILQTLGKRTFWAYIGVFGIFTNIGVAAYYCYIETWTLSYFFHSIKGSFLNLSQNELVLFFDRFINFQTTDFGIPFEAVVFFVMCILLNSFILSKGLKGIETIAKVGMPLLILFGAFLALKSLILGATAASALFPEANAWDGLNYLFTPQYDSIWKPRVWLAAAGQVFFTLSVGMGTIHCYAAYIKPKDDIALNAVSAGFTNEFVEIVLGSLIVVPLAAGYLGLDWVKANIGFGIAFQTMPYLFAQWGTLLAAIAGVLWFGLLFFAGITSSLAMGTPWMSFMRDEYGWNQRKGAYSFGLLTLLLGLPCVLFYHYGVFEEYDYWVGTITLVVFALAEMILFSWVFGLQRGWAEITMGAQIKIPSIYRFIIKYVTPVLLIAVLLGAIFTPVNNDWIEAFSLLSQGYGWEFDSSSLIGQLAQWELRTQIAVSTDQEVVNHVQKELWLRNGARIVLTGLFAFIALLVYKASKKHSQIHEH
ncbi:sodium:calcium symporter [Marinoscillum pacificum]|uniref:sodium:calcium symporter n=1 Tax=Marinoscillum pacificum TaxID=392723 RepID=UPI0021584081|nr:sodium:calcium symporter [Marinoscillum pacificum]